jgi:23S rRNA pseudouridine2605 synthase
MPHRPPPSFGPHRPHPRKRATDAPRKRAADIPAEFTDAARGVRLQKVLAAAGVASRRDSETLITTGRVTVNGQRIAALPAWVDPYRDRIEVDGQALVRPRRPKPVGRAGARHPGGPADPSPEASEAARVALPPVGLLYVMLHKPRKVISTTRDPDSRRSLADLVHIEGAAGPVRLFPVGRLDADTSGLILLTNDGELAHRLTHARYGVTKEYLVSVKGRLEEDDIARFEAELAPRRRADPRMHQSADLPINRSTDQPINQLTDQPINQPAERVQIVTRQRDQTHGDRTLLRVVLREGQNRDVRRLMAWLGFKVRRIQRAAIGPLRLQAAASGAWRFLNPAEVKALKKAVGLAR